jgi:hypothetical protein
MRRGPEGGQRSKTDFVANARKAWGADMPDWVRELAGFATRESGTEAAKKIGYSGAVVTQVCGKKYPGDLARVEAKVRGALMGQTVICPVLGEIGRDRCLDEQKKKHAGTSALRARLFRACRGGCPHSRIERKE